jgi:hypothetical protein
MHPLTRKLLSPAGFVLVGLLFLLPFVTASCDSRDVPLSESFTGVNLGTHQPPQVDPVLRAEANIELTGTAAGRAGTVRLPRPVPVEWTVVAAFGAVVIGALTALARRPWTRAVSGVAAAGVAGILLTGGAIHAREVIYHQVPVDVAPLAADVTSGSVVGFQVYLDYGFWLVIGVLAVLVAGNATHLVRLARRARTG